MRIGNTDLGARPVTLAPMEEVTDHSFRQICRERGADMVHTEFVGADAVSCEHRTHINSCPA